jgi:hypothetical protein
MEDVEDDACCKVTLEEDGTLEPLAVTVLTFVWFHIKNKPFKNVYISHTYTV